MSNIDESKSTGERLLTGYFDKHSVEHLHRYAIAAGFSIGKKVLDIASGEGYGSNILAQHASFVHGVDIDPKIIDHAKARYQRTNLRFLEGSADQIPLADRSVDFVVSFETLEHHDRHEEMYLEIKRVLAPEGVLMISTPDKKYFSDLTGHRNDYHVKELYREEFVELTRRYFRNVSISSQISSVCSVITDADISGRLRVFNGDLQGFTASEDLPTPAYHICLASDGVLPRTEASVFETRQLLSRMETEAIQLKRQLDQLTRVHSDLQGSMSLRLGRALLAPLRAVLRRD